MAYSSPFSPTLLRSQGRHVASGALVTGLLLGLFGAIAAESLEPLVTYPLGALAFGATYFFICSRTFPRIETESWLGRIALQAVIAVLAMTATSFLVVNAVLIAEYRVWMFTRDGQGGLIAERAITYFLLPILPVAAMCVLQFNQSWAPMLRLENRARRADELAASAQLEALRAQIDPHFLFNSLNSIAHLISTDPERAEACVERLAEIFRYLLSSKDRAFVTLADELEIADGYLDIERARFGEQLRVQFDVEARARSWIVPTLILQPLVENAVRHGISKKVGGGTVSVQARVSGGELVVGVHDTGVGMTDGPRAASSNGVGLRNVSDRLVHLYGRAYAPKVDTAPNQGTRITLRVPRESTSDGSAAPRRDGSSLR